jgi:hypothetical protein
MDAHDGLDAAQSRWMDAATSSGTDANQSDPDATVTPADATLADDTSAGTDAAPVGTDAMSGGDAAAGALQFGVSCDPAHDQCDSSMQLACHPVGQFGNVCTKPCAQNADCPAGSMGPKCSGMGFCRP